MDMLLDRPEFQTRTQSNDPLHFIRLSKKKTHLLAWEVSVNTPSSQRMKMVTVPLQSLTEETLTELEIWPSLSAKLQKDIQSQTAVVKQVIHDRMDNARKARRTKYGADVPRELTCGCGFHTTIGPALLLQRAEAANVSYQDFAANYKCGKCSPKGRGRQADPKYAGMPRSLTCSKKACDNTTTIGPGLLLQKAEEAGVSWEEYAKSYLCRSCKSAAGLLKRTRKNKKRKKAEKS